MSTKSIIDEMVMPASEHKVTEKRLKLIQYGESKAGKSYRAATAAIWGPVLYFDFDDNFSRTALDFEKSPHFANLTVVKANTFSEGKEAEDRFRKLVNELIAEGAAGKARFKTIVIDSWTAWERIVMNAILGDDGKGVVNKTPDVAAFQRNAQSQRTWIQKFLNGLKPYNVIINCHMKWAKDEQLGIMKPDLTATGQLGLELRRFSNELHYLEYKNGKHTVRVVPDHRFDAFTKLSNKPANGLLDNTSLEVFSEFAFK